MKWNASVKTYITIPPPSSFSSPTYGVESSDDRLDSMFLYLNEDLGVQEDYKFRLVSDEVIQYIYTINFSIICTVCSLFGIVANIINIIIFRRQGFRETVNIALFGLSISDFCVGLCLLWVAICYNPLFMYSSVPMLSIEIQHKTGSWTHVIFSRVSAFLTVYITLERCLCIAFPLKIKTLVTPRRVTAIIVMIYVVILGSMGTYYANFLIAWKFVPSRNRTMLGVIYKANRYTLQAVTYYLNVLYPFLSLTVVVICSGVLILKLNQRRKWLNSATSTYERTAMTKDRQVVKMIVTVATIFICCFTPSALLFLAIAVEPEFNVGKKYENLFVTLNSIGITLTALNSSVNIFVYYKMSSKYKKQLHKLFFGDQDRIK